ncbi:zinc-dependent peptidase [Pelagicoccus sp. SDUM812005]|uniref:M90 family metallopeptidase n=1 Tax=Pelagicoccus sp. SDUM812005 TaxID=3041257 RepID=UPI00280EE9B4|nr:zinc-dependent peptidase [Pelagicoccus sp. SDUM812005]MDQ8183645.1 zinc-dependent peptidase [Pelagicoccus sp. SDUM812005]
MLRTNKPTPITSSTYVLLFVFLGIPALLFGGQYLFARRYRAKKQAVVTADFPDTWNAILLSNVPLVSKLPSHFRQRLETNIKLFLAEVSFEGQGGVQITDEIRVTVAAQACLLTVGREDKRYPRLKNVIIYPSAFTDSPRAPNFDPDNPTYRLGESWTTGTVILAWDSTKRGAINIHDGRNVALHEFAHQLDQEDGVGDGVPIFQSQSAFTAWSQVFTKEYEIQVKKATKGRRSVLDHYGATNYAEFFAVSTEAFFEKPKQLKRKRPEIYKILKNYYRLDPVSW